LAAHKLQPGVAIPTRSLLAEVVQLLRARTPVVRPETTQLLLNRLGPAAAWRINLCQAVDVLLTGEVVVRYWARAYLDASGDELLALFESINRIFHELIRDYALRYCDQCHAIQQAEARA
jgi:hypothetical protein